jgi:hypothetical protein
VVETFRAHCRIEKRFCKGCGETFFAKQAATPPTTTAQTVPDLSGNPYLTGLPADLLTSPPVSNSPSEHGEADAPDKTAKLERITASRKPKPTKPPKVCPLCRREFTGRKTVCPDCEQGKVPLASAFVPLILPAQQSG